MRYSTRPQTTIATAKGSPTPAKDARLMGMRPGRKRAADKIEVDDDLKAFLHQTYLQGLTQAVSATGCKVDARPPSLCSQGTTHRDGGA